MPDPSLSPEAVEAQAPDLEFPELARPVKAEGLQYAGLTPVERALAEDDLHMSTCDEPSIDGCGDCQRKLARFRRLLEVATPVIAEQEAIRLVGQIAAAIEAYEPDAHPVVCPPSVVYAAATEQAVAIVRGFAPVGEPEGTQQ